MNIVACLLKKPSTAPGCTSIPLHLDTRTIFPYSVSKTTLVKNAYNESVPVSIKGGSMTDEMKTNTGC